MINTDQTLKLLQASNDLAAQRETIKKQAQIIAERDREIRSMRFHIAHLETRLLPEITPSQKAISG